MDEAGLARILIVGPVPPPLGGMALQGRLLEKRLQEEGLRASVLPTNPPLGQMARWPVLRTIAGLLLFLRALATGLRRHQVVHILGASGLYFLLRVTPAVLLARLGRRRVIVNYRGGLAEVFLRRHGWWARSLLRRAQQITVPSPYLERIFRQHRLPVTVIPNISDLERFHFRERMPLKPHLLVCRNLEPMYNVGLALEVFRRLRAARLDARLTIVGTGSQEAELRAKAASANLKGVSFRGAVAPEDMPAVYETHDIALNPTNVDNMPISVLEGMAAGLVVISTAAGGVADLITAGEDGLLTPCGDPAAMLDAVLAVLDDPARAQRLVTAGRKTAARFAWEAVRPRLLATYGLSQDSP